MRNKVAKNNAMTASDVGNGDEFGDCWLLKFDDVCQRLKLSKAQGHKLRRAGKILRPTVTFGRSPRWLSSEFFDWLRAGCPAAVYWTWKEKGRGNGK